jgi:hypothetical protein
VNSYSGFDPLTAPHRYLADLLTESERQAYEASLVRDPELLRELEATARLKLGLLRLRERGELDGLIRESRRTNWQYFLPIAAALAALVIGPMLWRSGVSPTSPSVISASLGGLTQGSDRELPLGGVEAVMRRRASSADATVVLPAARSAIELRVLPQVPHGGPYRAELRRSDNGVSSAPIGAAAHLELSEDGFVNVYVDSTALRPGSYTLDLVNLANANAQRADSFHLVVVPSRGR